jgi:glycine/D-amino acid oxidase-like deaminating enzyme
MPRDTGTTASVWIDVQPPQLEALTGDQTCDVCVIGAGIAGLTTAYMLSNSAEVIVLEDGSVGGGETGRTTAHLTYALDDRYFHLAKVRGKDVARLAAQSHMELSTDLEARARSRA